MQRSSYLGYGLVVAAALASPAAAAAKLDVEAIAHQARTKDSLRVIVQPPEVIGTGDSIEVVVGEAGTKVELRDDGGGLDRVAGDGYWVGGVPGPFQGDVLFTLNAGEGEPLWSDTVPIDPELAQRWVALMFTESRVVVDVGGGPPGPTEGVDPAMGPGPEGAPAPGEKGPPGLSPPAGGAASGGWMVPVLTGVLGVVLGWLLARRRKPRLPPVASPIEGDAPTGPTRIIEDHVPALLSERVRKGPVLLVPSDAHREEWREFGRDRPLVRWMESDRPTARQVRRARRLLAGLGPCTVIVDGLGALEPPDDDEAEDAVFQELVDDDDGEVVLVLSSQGEGSA